MNITTTGIKKKIILPPKKKGLIPDGADLSGLLDAAKGIAAEGGDGRQILFLAHGEVHEDENQPRRADNPGFSEESIAGLAETIYKYGVKTPISVRRREEGGYVINHGARRLRATKFAHSLAERAGDAEKMESLRRVPAIIDECYGKVDQFIENLQREALTPMETAVFIGELLASGMKKGEVAKAIGKSAAFVSQHSTLLNLPEPIANAFETGRVSDVTVVNELVKAYNDNPQHGSREGVAAWLAQTDEVTRGTVAQLREFVQINPGVLPVQEPAPRHVAVEEEVGRDKPHGSREAEKPFRPVLRVSVKSKEFVGEGTLDFRRRPGTAGSMWVKADGGTEITVAAKDISIVELIDG
ncbi:MAG: ParB/RepB/Spo0J family partition protein [Azoarcus sp.]|jgi:ParB family chromosome partitioning protein|nr:ParB/RepB/Spo0J family partition protein [Azoarcus sp.]